MLIRQWEVFRTLPRTSKETNTLDLDKKTSFKENTENKNKASSQAGRRIRKKTPKLQNSNKTKLQNANATRSTKTIQEHNKNRDRHEMHKLSQDPIKQVTWTIN